jgi:hypothetical protein
VALDIMAHGATAERFDERHDGDLSMSRGHVALSYSFEGARHTLRIAARMTNSEPVNPDSSWLD